MDQRSRRTSPALHRVFHNTGAPSHITFGSQGFPPTGTEWSRGAHQHHHQPAVRRRHVKQSTGRSEAQNDLLNTWSLPPLGQPGCCWDATPEAATEKSAGGDELCWYEEGPRTTPLVQVERCASKAPGIPAGMTRGREVPALKAMEVSASHGDNKGRLPRSEVSRLCSKLEAIVDKRTTQHSFVARAVHDAAPAVVRIDAQKKIAVSDTSIFDILFGVVGGSRGSHQQRKQIVTGTGSGFCIDSSGIVLTNAHVVEDADSLGIQLQSGKNYTGHVVGMHSELDLAVVKVDVKDDRLPSVCVLAGHTL